MDVHTFTYRIQHLFAKPTKKRKKDSYTDSVVISTAPQPHGQHRGEKRTGPRRGM
jgi:hypothetical protein